jgi:hypothetical protein
MILVLEEIRDLQRQHAERCGVTIAVILAVTMLVLILLRVVARLP